ncbi:hypothetical protein ACRAWD_11275 [Caulobacter segnis]
MEFKTAQRQRFVKGLRSVLDQVEMFANIHIAEDCAPLFDGLLGRLEKADRDALIAYISDRPLYHFVSEFLYNRLLHHHARHPLRTPISSLPGVDLDALAEEITAAIETLPWSYVFSIEVPVGGLPKSFAWSLRDDVILARGAKAAALVRENATPPPLSKLLSLFPETGEPHVHLLVGVKGLVNVMEGTRPYFLGMDRLKALLGLMMAIEMVDYAPEWDREEQSVRVGICLRQPDGVFEHVDTGLFGRADADTFTGLISNLSPDLTSPETWRRHGQGPYQRDPPGDGRRSAHARPDPAGRAVVLRKSERRQPTAAVRPDYGVPGDPGRRGAEGRPAQAGHQRADP